MVVKDPVIVKIFIRHIVRVVVLASGLLWHGLVHANDLNIVAAGDSITRGCCGSGEAYDSYRRELETLLQENACSYVMKGSQTQASNSSSYAGRHEGYSGWWAYHFINGHPSGPRAIATTVQVEEPDVILLHLGSNDLNGTGPGTAVTVDQALDSIRQVINKINSQADSIDLARPKILLAKPVPWYTFDPTNGDNPDITADIESFGKKISDAITSGFPITPGSTTRQTVLANVFEVDGFTGYEKSFMQSDGVHPNPEGEKFLASVFYQGLVDAGVCEYPVPERATLASPGGNASATPAYSWNAVSNSSWYYLWVRDSTGVPIKKWYTAEDAGCPSDSETNGSETCTVNPAVSVDGEATWWVRTWNKQGYGPWSTSLRFSTANIPEQPILISPKGSNADATPVYTWEVVQGATWYYLWVNDSTGTPVRSWYEVSANELSCNEASCTIDPDVAINGSATWWVRAWNKAGYGSWSSGMSFNP